MNYQKIYNMEITRKLIKSEYVHTITSGELEGAVINEIVYGNAPPTFFSYKFPNKYFKSLKEVTDYLKEHDDNR